MDARSELRTLVETLPDALIDEALNRIVALVEYPDEPWDLSDESDEAIREYLEGRAELITGEELRSGRAPRTAP